MEGERRDDGRYGLKQAKYMRDFKLVNECVSE